MLNRVLLCAGEDSQEEPAAESAGSAVTQAAEQSTEASAAEAHADEDTVRCTAGAAGDEAAAAADIADGDATDIPALGREESAELSPAQHELAMVVGPPDLCMLRRWWCEIPTSPLYGKAQKKHLSSCPGLHCIITQLACSQRPAAPT